MIHSPAQIMMELAISKGLGSRQGTQNPWPIFYGVMPTDPDNVISFYDTTPRKDGRIQGTGETIMHPGIQVRVRRTPPYNEGWNKADDICSTFDTIRNESLTFGGRTYLIKNISRPGGVIPIGQEQGKTRLLFTANFTLTLSDITP